MTKLKDKEYKKFEDIKHIREDGSEFWSARVQIPAHLTTHSAKS